MDRRVKERLVGATILGVLIVLLVPELLSGPKPAAPPVPNPTEIVRNVTVDLTTRQSVPAVTPAAEEAESARAVAAAPLPATAPPIAAPSTEAPPAALETPSSSPKSAANEAASRAWAVQVGSFASRDNADKLVRELKARGFAVYAVSIGSGASLRHKVRVGPIADRGAAERAVSQLKGQRYAGSIVPPAP